MSVPVEGERGAEEVGVEGGAGKRVFEALRVTLRPRAAENIHVSTKIAEIVGHHSLLCPSYLIKLEQTSAIDLYLYGILIRQAYYSSYITYSFRLISPYSP